jgi:hypothetical protein
MSLLWFIRRATLIALAAVAAALTSGCASTRLIDSEVNSFASTPPPLANATFRFERLPSDAGSAAQDGIESMAKPALAKAGLVITDKQPAYSVQIQLERKVSLADPRNPGQPYRMDGFGPPMRFGRESGRYAGGSGLFFNVPWYQLTLQLVIRDVSSSVVVYQSSAVFDSPWSDTENIFPTLVEAALQGYPAPPAGKRIVAIELLPQAKNP